MSLYISLKYGTLNLSCNLAKALCSTWKKMCTWKCWFWRLTKLLQEQPYLLHGENYLDIWKFNRNLAPNTIYLGKKCTSPSFVWPGSSFRLPTRIWKRQIFGNETSKTVFTWTFRRIINIDIRHQSSKFEINILKIAYFTDQ